ncbi:hypothetical protein HCZ97_07125 [Pseudooceanicola sp. HF7]|nr:hypothetical protein [Pseudooceanicola sp. HF7]
MPLALVAACAVPPSDVTPQQSANFDAAVASIGCELRTERDYLPVELQTGMTRDQVIAMAQYRMAMNMAVGSEDGAVRLTTGPCAPSA